MFRAKRVIHCTSRGGVSTFVVPCLIDLTKVISISENINRPADTDFLLVDGTTWEVETTINDLTSLKYFNHIEV